MASTSSNCAVSLHRFGTKFGVELIGAPRTDDAALTVEELCSQAMPFIERRLAMADAMVLLVAESDAQVGRFITWNAKHFRGKTGLDVVTPAEYLSDG